MPPRYAYWTIIIDDAPTAFRAREREELVPTFRQLASRNPTATIKWFARGRLWDSPEQARAAAAPPREPRGKDWRPGGRHEDPRARFDKKKSENRRREHPGAKAPAYNPQPDGTSRSRPAQAPSGERPHGPNRERDRERAAHREHAANREFVGRGFGPANRGRDRSPREGSNRPPQAPKWDASRHQGPRRRGKWDSQPTERPRGPGADKRGFRPPDSRTENRGPHGKGPQDRGPHGKGPQGKGPQGKGCRYFPVHPRRA